MKAVLEYSKNIARAKMYIVGEVEESFSSWTQHSYGTGREGAELPAWLGDGEDMGQLSNEGISNFLSLMWNAKMPACLPVLRLIDNYSGGLKNWEIETYMVGIVSLQHIWWCVIRDFLKDFS